MTDHIDRIVDIIDVGLQKPASSPVSLDPEQCARCQSHPPHDEDSSLCTGCRDFLLEDSDKDPCAGRAFDSILTHIMGRQVEILEEEMGRRSALEEHVARLCRAI